MSHTQTLQRYYSTQVQLELVAPAHAFATYPYVLARHRHLVVVLRDVPALAMANGL
jgi:hypothetical protein